MSRPHSRANWESVVGYLAEPQGGQKVRFDLDSPQGRLAALEALGVPRYNEELAKCASREDVVAMAGGHEVVIVRSRSGLLHYVNGTGKAFPELESAIAFAEENPT
jgi:hypothetical protein